MKVFLDYLLGAVVGTGLAGVFVVAGAFPYVPPAVAPGSPAQMAFLAVYSATVLLVLLRLLRRVRDAGGPSCR